MARNWCRQFIGKQYVELWHHQLMKLRLLLFPKLELSTSNGINTIIFFFKIKVGSICEGKSFSIRSETSWKDKKQFNDQEKQHTLQLNEKLLQPYITT